MSFQVKILFFKPFSLKNGKTLLIFDKYTSDTFEVKMKSFCSSESKQIPEYLFQRIKLSFLHSESSKAETFILAKLHLHPKKGNHVGVENKLEKRSDKKGTVYRCLKIEP